MFAQKLGATGQPAKVIRIDLRDGTRRELTGFRQPCYVRAFKDKILCLENGGDLFVADLDGTPVLQVKRSPKRRIGWPEIGKDALVWDDENGPVLLTLKDLRIRYLADRKSVV